MIIEEKEEEEEEMTKTKQEQERTKCLSKLLCLEKHFEHLGHWNGCKFT